MAGSLGQAGQDDWRKDWRFWYLAVLCSILPDVDVLGFSVGIRYGDLWGHRGMTHSLLFAAVVAVLMAARLRSAAGQRWKLILLLFVITASHGVLDAMTDGGIGIAFFAPFDAERYYLPWQPIAVSPIGVRRFLTSRGVVVLVSEARWVWLPSLLVAAVGWWLTRRRPPATA